MATDPKTLNMIERSRKRALENRSAVATNRTQINQGGERVVGSIGQGSFRENIDNDEETDESNEYGFNRTEEYQNTQEGGRGGVNTRVTASIEQSSNELSYTTRFLIIGTALIFDGIQGLLEFIPVAGWILNDILDPIFGVILWWWFKSKGVKFTRANGLALGSSVIIKLIPIIGALPTWTASVLFIILKEKAKKIVQNVPGGQKAVEAISKAA